MARNVLILSALMLLCASAGAASLQVAFTGYAPASATVMVAAGATATRRWPSCSGVTTRRTTTRGRP